VFIRMNSRNLQSPCNRVSRPGAAACGRTRVAILLVALMLLLVAGCNRGERAADEALSTPTGAVEAPSGDSDTGVEPVLILSATVPATLSASLEAPVASAPAADVAAAPSSAAAPSAAPATTPAEAAPAPAESAPAPADGQSLLAEGRRLYRIGNYDLARAALEQALGLAADNLQLRLQARYELARTLVASADHSAALSVLDALDAEAATLGDADAVARDLVLRARALEGLGDANGAIQTYWAYLDAVPWMAEGIQPRVAQAYLTLGNAEGAATAFRRAAESSGTAAAQVGWLERVAQTWLDADSPAAAAAVYDEILAIAQNPGYRAQILQRAGSAHAAAGNEVVALERWRAATEAAPATDSAYLALVELINRDQPFDLYQRGYIDLMASAFLPAISAYESYLADADPTDARYAAAVHELGQSYLGAGRTIDAIGQFDRIVLQFPQCPCFGQAWIDKGRAYAAAGDNVSARRIWRTFARDHAGDPLAADALWYSGLNALNSGNNDEAATDFLALADAFPASERAPAALYALGIGDVREGNVAATRDLFARLKRDYPDYRSANVGYWLGRAHQALGEDAPAREAWQAVVDRTPDLYYGVLSAQALAGLPSTDAAMLANVGAIAGPTSRIPGDDGSQAFAEAWLRQWEPFAGVDAPAQLPQAVAEDIDLARGRALLEMDLRSEGLDALDRVYQRYRDDPRALYPLGLEFERIGAYRFSISAIARLMQFSPAGLVENAPAFLQRMAWPLHFEELIATEAQAHDMDPFLYFGMVRQESLFEEGARSYAAAQGLAQIIPDTARWVAERQGHPDWSNELIYRPYINVNFGAFYFDWVRDFLDGNEVSALVGYNAGPGNSEAWRGLSGPDDPLFVEMLGFNEPRLYVQLITENLYHYNRLYGGRYGG
jgi:soluble lytic murein transglycosylase